MIDFTASRLRLYVSLAGLAALSACATPAPKPTPVPTQAVQIIPPRPVVPGGAPLDMVMPPMGPDGVRRTVNYGLSDSQKVWNLRSALNVAALNCRDPRYTGIATAYEKMLKRNKQTLSGVYRRVLNEHKAEHGKNQMPAYDSYMTKVYNYFALPPAKREFCDVANQIATESLPIEGRAAMQAFAGPALARVENVFHDFYSRYEQFHVDAAAWDAQYGTPAASSTYGSTAPATTYGPSAPASSSAAPGSTIQNVDVPPSTNPPG